MSSQKKSNGLEERKLNSVNRENGEKIKTKQIKCSKELDDEWNLELENNYWNS